MSGGGVGKAGAGDPMWIRGMTLEIPCHLLLTNDITGKGHIGTSSHPVNRCVRRTSVSILDLFG